jgi:SAM-dependent methyltransferase
MSKPQLSQAIRNRLACPRCRAPLQACGDSLLCTGSACARRFPVVADVPVLINEEQSVFAIDDFVKGYDTTFHLQPSRINRLLSRLIDMLPSIGHSIGATRNYEQFGRLLTGDAPNPIVLVIGGSILGAGMEGVTRDSRIELVATDVSFGPMTMIVCDAHDIPFADATFDGVVVQATLEHVVDPYRCVSEIERVLKPRGLVYAETPFIQQVHMGAYDFTRFTHSGHRRLFRHFSEVASGPICGPGMALAWSYQYFLLSFVRAKLLRGLVRAFSSVTAFPLKYADYYLMDKKGAIDSASGFYFMGRKEGGVLSDRDLVRYYRGADST